MLLTDYFVNYLFQECYDRLSNLRSSLQQSAENLVEKLRQELHVYGFLEKDRKSVV